MARTQFPISCPSALHIVREQYRRTVLFPFDGRPACELGSLCLSPSLPGGLPSFFPPVYCQDLALHSGPLRGKKNRSQVSTRENKGFLPRTIHCRASQKGKPKQTHHTTTWDLSIFLIPSPQHQHPAAPSVLASPSAPLLPLRCKEGGRSHRYFFPRYFFPQRKISFPKRNFKRSCLS